jgi:hypothetical protein
MQQRSEFGQQPGMSSVSNRGSAGESSNRKLETNDLEEFGPLHHGRTDDEPPLDSAHLGLRESYRLADVVQREPSIDARLSELASRALKDFEPPPAAPVGRLLMGSHVRIMPARTYPAVSGRRGTIRRIRTAGRLLAAPAG